MDANAKLADLRCAIDRYRDAAKNNPRGRNAWARDIVRVFGELDSYLSQGGTPPTAWSEGPDVPDEHIYVPEPLGGPVPGTNGSHLPEEGPELADPGPPADAGDTPHAHPAELARETTCTACGGYVFYDGTDDEGTGIWSHTETGDYWCAA